MEPMQPFFSKITEITISIIGKLIAATAVFLIGKAVISFLMRRLRYWKLLQRTEETIKRFLTHLIQITLYFLLVLVIIAILGVPIASVTAAIASAGVAIGLALQGSLSNFASGIMILLFRPFRLGNRITVEGESGIVTDIGIFYTVLQTADHLRVVIPNGKIMGNTIVNLSAYSTRRLELTVPVAYGSSVSQIRAVLLKETQKHPLILREPMPVCHVGDYGDSGLTIILRVWSRSEDHFRVRFELLEAVYSRLQAENIEISYPTVKIRRETERPK